MAAPRFTGTVSAWNDERGFGFIQADQGGPEIFAHIKSFPARNGRPQPRQRVSFEVEIGREGKKRASKVALVQAARAPAPRAPRRQDSPAPWSAASALAIPAFVLVYAAVALLWRVPAWVAGLYLVASAACFLAYAIDKSAATAGRWRIAESTLLLLGLAGGWPGAIVAQQLLRHKTSKAAFRAAFWGTVALNVVAFVVLHAPLLQAWRR
ncbi:DUF1294 domain-containing protein [Pseudorhodoferax soli]|uniref:Uncharacterized membrane protein YsdA (DUF1294 family) n=1 Tax=Pseudorhodoferax soli TaxID=545864 RepID=A0A368XNU7_9BURK|nr:DUF1294 domain-containing protein [Pseudorhodoferax soli]RCW69229.1 uncharacterized membrane protein YsdA (DUF1294 family) [Pseudorhodoferax soli]